MFKMNVKILKYVLRRVSVSTSQAARWTGGAVPALCCSRGPPGGLVSQGTGVGAQKVSRLLLGVSQRTVGGPRAS